MNGRGKEPGERSNGFVRAEIESATAALIGKPLWTCRRAADMATFQFGGRIKGVDYYGRPSQVGDYALHVQCAWRITRGDEIVVGSGDLYYPAEYQNEHEEFPADFDWRKHPNRRDKLLRLLFENDVREFIVQRIEVGIAGNLRIELSGGGFFFGFFVTFFLSNTKGFFFLFKEKDTTFVVCGGAKKT